MAKNASCRQCNKIGHFAGVCKSSKFHSLEENYSSDDEEGLNQDMHLLRVTGLESTTALPQVKMLNGGKVFK